MSLWRKENADVINCSQCHSGANQHKKATDLRLNELFVSLSEVDRLRPEVFLFENVRGFLGARADGTFVAGEGISNNQSFAHLALQTLIDMR